MVPCLEAQLEVGLVFKDTLKFRCPLLNFFPPMCTVAANTAVTITSSSKLANH